MKGQHDESLELRPKSWAWLLVLTLSLLPFFFRVSLDFPWVQRSAVSHLYRMWLVDQGYEVLKGQEQIVFLSSEHPSSLERVFLEELRKDFRVLESGEGPVVQVFFNVSSSLAMRLELKSSGKDRSSWQGTTRIINNGILLGLWVLVCAWLLGLGLKKLVASASFLILFWHGHWNLLQIPQNLLQEIWLVVLLAKEALSGIMPQSQKQTIFLWAGIFATVLVRPFLRLVLQKIHLKRKYHEQILFGASFLLEPIYLWAAIHVAGWQAGAEAWKVVLGSYLFRFCSFSFLFLKVFSRQDPSFSRRPSHLKAFWGEELSSATVTLIFLLCGGAAWLGSVVAGVPGDGVYFLKCFLMAVLVGALCGSRFLGLALGLSTLAFVSPPTLGHWATATQFGFFLDGLLVGSLLSPLRSKRFFELWSLTLKQGYGVMALSWVFGIFLSAAGVPLGLCWIATILSVWALLQIRSGGLWKPSSAD